MYIKPAKLNPGDKVLAVSLSRWGPGACPTRYAAWKKQLEDALGVQVVEWKYTMADPTWIYNHPEARAEDLMEWFRNTDIKAIFSTIGGEESIRILPYIDYTTIRQNPKIFMWYSDTTITHFICQKAGIISFYGPSIMAWFGENWGLFDYMLDSVRTTICSTDVIGRIIPNTKWRTSEFLPRENADLQQQKRKLQASQGRNWLQWSGVHTWTLIGGCADVFPFVQGTDIRPKKERWRGKLLCLETSEENMSPQTFERILRNLWSQWILQHLSGILIGRTRFDYATNEQISYDEVLLKIVSKEFSLPDLPLVTNMDFGHTDPVFVLPLGCQAELNCDEQKFSITENACV